MKKSFDKPFVYLLFLLPLELSLDLFLYVTENQVNINHNKEILFTIVFSLWQVIIYPIFNKYGVRNTLFFNILSFGFGGLICSISTNKLTYFIGRMLEAIGSAGSQVGAYSYVCHLEPSSMKRTLGYIKTMVALSPLTLPFIGLYIIREYNFEHIHILICLYALLIMILISQLEEHSDSGRNLVSIFNQDTFKLLKNSKFIYYAFCIFISQLLMFSFFSHPLVYFFILKSESDLFYVIVYILAIVIMGWYITFRLCNNGLKKYNLFSAFLYFTSAFLIIFFKKNELVLFCSFLTASCGSLILLTTSMVGIVLLDAIYSEYYVTWLGLFEAMGSGLISQLMCESINITLNDYSILLISSGLIILLIQALHRRILY